jgi:hypothetical protein
MIHKLRTPGRLVIPFPVSTTRSVDRMYRCDPMNTRTKRRRTLRSPVGKGSANSTISLAGAALTNVRPRLLGFLACLAGAIVCFVVAFFTLPLLALRPAKFALSFRYAQITN